MHKHYIKMNQFAITIFTNTWMHCLSAGKFGQVHGYSLPENWDVQQGTVQGLASHQPAMTCGEFSSLTSTEEALSLQRQN